MIQVRFFDNKNNRLETRYCTSVEFMQHRETCILVNSKEGKSIVTQTRNLVYIEEIKT